MCRVSSVSKFCTTGYQNLQTLFLFRAQRWYLEKGSLFDRLTSYILKIILKITNYEYEYLENLEDLENLEYILKILDYKIILKIEKIEKITILMNILKILNIYIKNLGLYKKIKRLTNICFLYLMFL